jgi:FdhD protein
VRPIERIRVRGCEGETEIDREESVAVEEPLAIRVRTEDGRSDFSLVTTMRTPGHDEDLAAGFLFAEGVIDERGELLRLSRPDAPRMDAELRSNVLVATLRAPAADRARRLRRGTVMGSACGVCGRTSIESVIPPGRPPISGGPRVRAEILYSLPEKLRARQSIFARTGGLHAAGLFAADGALRELREDIGRHNATDKLVGSFLLRGELPLSDAVLVVSGRAGFEIVQKAFCAGIPVVASVSAPSSLAVGLAESGGVTLVGFLRDQRFNIYANPHRILGAERSPG